MATASIGARQIGNSTPASIALASGFGMRVIARPRLRHSPHSTMSAAETRNAPTASENRMPPPDAASSTAAPGVDHAIASGMRSQSAPTVLTTAIARHTAKRPDAASASEAPTACSPAITSTNEVANPEMAATNPAEIGWRTDVLFDGSKPRGEPTVCDAHLMRRWPSPRWQYRVTDPRGDHDEHRPLPRALRALHRAAARHGRE